MRKLTILFLLVLIIGKLRAQEIKILDVKQKEIQSSSYLLITCELVNNSGKEIILPLQSSSEYPYSYNLITYLIISKPDKALYYRESPPPAMTGRKITKFSKKSLLICPPKTSKIFTIDSSEMGAGAVLSGKKIKKVQIQYHPHPIHEKDRYFEEDIKDIKFYDKKIQSKYFKIKKYSL